MRCPTLLDNLLFTFACYDVVPILGRRVENGKIHKSSIEIGVMKSDHNEDDLGSLRSVRRSSLHHLGAEVMGKAGSARVTNIEPGSQQYGSD